MIRKSAMAVSIAALTLVPALSAQSPQHPPGQRGMGQMMAQPMMGRGAMMMCGDAMGAMSGLSDPATLLRGGKLLALSNRQKTALEAIQTRHTSLITSSHQQAMAARQKAAGTLSGPRPDVAAFETALKQASGFMVAAHVASVRAALEARSVLNADQLEKVKAVANMHPAQCAGPGSMMDHGQSH